MATKYHLLKENNPLWQEVEPRLISLWAKGIKDAEIKHLYFISCITLLGELGSLILKVVLRLIILAVLYTSLDYVFGDHFKYALSFIFNTIDFMEYESRFSPLLSDIYYELTAYLLLFSAFYFLFNNITKELIKELFYSGLFMCSGMLAVKYLAKKVYENNEWACIFVNNSYFTGFYIAATIAIVDPEIKEEYDELFDLYMKSNDEAARLKLIDKLKQDGSNFHA